MPEPTLLDLAHEHLGWPGRDDIFTPKGAGPRVIAETADKKIGSQIRRLPDGADAKVGILAANPYGNATEAPLALLCQFNRPARQETLLQLQRLAWNFAWARHLIVVEPQLIRSFTCCRPPGDKEVSDYEVTPQIETSQLSLSDQAAQALHWVNLISGEYVRENSARFARDGRVDSTLLANLSFARECLMEQEPGLEEDICHDLLARVVFIQFLIDRKDSLGNPALDATRLREICGHGTLGEALRHKVSAYKLFQFMNKKFNGDLFAGSADEPSQGSRGILDEEKAKVKDSHLGLLADLVEGKLAMAKGQWCLWRQYSFDVVPLAFISSIYEQFVTKKERKEKGAHYTRPHLVDFMLDGVLPWHGEAWDLRILDPACGSGIFLVKAFQRLVYRWKAAHERQSINPDQLKNLLESNLFGVDSNSHAVRVASFSLYLAMCEEIEPKSLWEQVRFPALRAKRIVCSDFFEEDRPGFRTVEDAESYDIVIGNPPWGKGSFQASAAAKQWAAQKKWPTPNNDVGPLFLAKAASLLKKTGIASLLQPAANVLTNLQSKQLRKRLFTSVKVEEVVNLSALRKWLFPKSKSPACIITFRAIPPDGRPLTYLCPKPSLDCDQENDDVIVLTPYDVNYIFPHEAEDEPRVWSVLMWGSRRDFNVVRSLGERTTLRQCSESGGVEIRGPIIRGNREKDQEGLLNRRIVEKGVDFGRYFLRLKASDLPLNQDPETDRVASTDLSAFEVPQLVIKESWDKSARRFRSFLIEPDDTGRGIVSTSSLTSVHAVTLSPEDLVAACVTYNSIFAVYYLFLSSGRFSCYRPEVLETDLLSVPLPEAREGLLGRINGPEDVDQRVREAFGFKELEWALIEDMTRYTVPSFHDKKANLWQRTQRQGKSDSELNLYCDFFRRVLKAGFGDDKAISFTIFEEKPGVKPLPVRLVAVHFDSPLGDTHHREIFDSNDLLGRLNTLYSTFMNPAVPGETSLCYRRIARVYDTTVLKGLNVPTVYLIKPDDVRLWTRSTALRDADEVSADIMSWSRPRSDNSLERWQSA